MKKHLVIFLFVAISYLCSNNLKAQTAVNDSSVYEHVIVNYQLGAGYGGASMFFADGKNIDLGTKLRLDTLSGNRSSRHKKGLLMVFNYMDKRGYELVTRVRRSCYIFRKKRSK